MIHSNDYQGLRADAIGLLRKIFRGPTGDSGPRPSTHRSPIRQGFSQKDEIKGRFYIYWLSNTTNQIAVPPLLLDIQQREHSRAALFGCRPRTESHTFLIWQQKTVGYIGRLYTGLVYIVEYVHILVSVFALRAAIPSILLPEPPRSPVTRVDRTLYKMRSSLLGILTFTAGCRLGFGQSVDCPDTCVTSGAHIITTRASLEPPGPGIMGVLADKIAFSCTGSDTEVR